MDTAGAKNNMKLNCQILSDSGKERIHRDSVEILETVGVAVRSHKAIQLLKKRGAIVDEADHVAKIPKEMLDQALSTAPRSFLLGARNPDFDFSLPSPATRYATASGTFAIDYHTGERRPGLVKDLEYSLRISEELDLAAFNWPTVIMHDVSNETRTIREWLYSFRFSSKHLQDEVTSIEQIPILIETLSAILGSEDAIKERGIFSVIYSTLPPLTHDEQFCEIYMELAKFHVPIVTIPMPNAGSTGPASLYSNIAVANAESLSALVLFQMAEPGTPILYGHSAGITNFRLGTFIEGAPESELMNSALTEMGHFYDLPVLKGGVATEAKQPGPQAVMEKIFTSLPSALNGVDICVGLGTLETSNLLCLEQIVVDHEIARMCQRIRNGVDVSDAKDLLEDVKAVGPRGHFLAQRSTREACRSDEFLQTELFDRNPHERWVELGKPDVYDKAREKVDEILSIPLKNPLPDDVLGVFEDIERRIDPH
jgi:trimethylamine--corrinoid protein Co-methyltransferase